MDKVAIVTGASAGIGLGIAKRFAREGAVVAMCSRTKATLDDAAAQVREIGGKVIHSTCDVSSPEQIDEFVGGVVEEAGAVDILVNNAAYIPSSPTPLEDIADEDFENAINGGLYSTYFFMKRVLPIMKEKGTGRIINFSSIGGIRGVHGAAGYGAAKMGIVGLTRVAANEWGKYGITVNCVAPMAMSETWAELMKTLPEGTDPWEAANVRSNAVGYVGDAEADVAPPVVFLASDDARYITGHVMPIDGGLVDLE